MNVGGIVMVEFWRKPSPKTDFRISKTRKISTHRNPHKKKDVVFTRENVDHDIIFTVII